MVRTHVVSSRVVLAVDDRTAVAASNAATDEDALVPYHLCGMDEKKNCENDGSDYDKDILLQIYWNVNHIIM